MPNFSFSTSTKNDCVENCFLLYIFLYKVYNCEDEWSGKHQYDQINLHPTSHEFSSIFFCKMLFKMSFDIAESGPQPFHSVRCPDHTLEDAFILSSQKINTDICFVVFCWFQNISLGLLQAAQHRQIQLHHSTTAALLFTALD